MRKINATDCIDIISLFSFFWQLIFLKSMNTGSPSSNSAPQMNNIVYCIPFC